MSKRPKGLSTIDIGCGNGAMTMYASTNGPAIGISNEDTNNTTANHLARAGRYSARFITIDARQLDTAWLDEFDNVICSEVIEHVLDDDKLIHDMAAIMKPGGMLFLTTPYLYHTRSKDEYVSPTETGAHVRWGYTYSRLRALFEKHGIMLTDEYWTSGIVSQTLLRMFMAVRKVSPALAVITILPLRPLTIFDPWLTRRTQYPPLSLAVVGVKNK
jgi:cyclopropane fatty-acyl-phospholipid synthase-like methyltransferase